MSKIRISPKQTSENQRIIEDWMKRNNSGRIIIGSNKITGVIVRKKLQNERRSLPTVRVTKTNNEGIAKFSISPNKLVNMKRNSLQSNVIKPKVAKLSSPAISIKIEPANKTEAPKAEEKKTCSNDLLPSIAFKQVPKSVPSFQYSNKKSSAQNNLKKTSLPTTKGIKNGNNHAVNKKNIEKPQLKDNKDVYSSVQDNYKYLLMPKHWSVTEFEADSCDQCIVFSKPQVVYDENEKLVTVTQKSLIIDKGGTIHYSVHGLAVDVKGTILPDVLDNIKKLLSIVHIFDKMQVCKGLGDDLLIVRTDNLHKDICQVWRHNNCKLLLVKADQCQICLDTRNELLEKELLFKSEVLATDYLTVTIKEELM